MPATNLTRFHVDVTTLNFIDRVGLKLATAERDTGRVMERIAAVQRENLQRLEDYIAILIKYLKTEDVPKAAFEVLEALPSVQQENWKAAIQRIADLREW